jgi:CheY-like chemotaxis protein
MKNILVIDTISREAMTLIYRLHNHTVIATGSGETAIFVCRRWKPDLIICGDMSDMTRTAFVSHLLEKATHRPLLVSIIRQWDDYVFQSCMAQALECGFDVAVRSPVNLPTLLLWARLAELRENTRDFFPRTVK